MSAKSVEARNELSCKWKVNNYSDYNLVGQCLISPVFSTAHSDGVAQWRLNLYPNGSQWPYKDYLSIFVEYLSDASVTARLSISILDVENRSAALERIVEQEKFQKGSARCGDHKFASRSFVANRLVKDNAITILCKIAFAKSASLKPRVNNAVNVKQYDRFEHLLETGKFSDVTLAIGDKKFRLHKVILTSCSPVFRAMFEHNMKESQSNIVDILDIRHEVMSEIIRFMYTNKVNGIEDLAVELLIAADMYAIDELKELCEKTLCTRLGIDSAIQLLTLAFTFNASNLKNSVIEFIIQHLEDFLGKTEFKMLDSNIVNELLAAIAKKKMII